MREIKFRVWSRSQGYMDLPTSISIDDSGHVEGVRGYGGDYPYTDIELMQFTGLHDKNGREIYEGDIVKCKAYSYGNGEGKFSQLTVKYHELSASFIAGPCHLGDVMNFRGVEVVGNIYENPELLEASK